MSLLSMTKTNLKALFHGPYTSQFPLKAREPFANTRGHIDCDLSTCIFCTLCDKKCPTGAISVTRSVKATDTTPEKKGTWSIEPLKCIQCGYCVETCNKNSLIMKGECSEPATENVR
ncbi:NADH-quinone oxidoreductase subunit I 1 [Clostridia bacterium]|nr:NADH-quinone oxidoreductase subunit I 1 [Clostridia bacterium]